MTTPHSFRPFWDPELSIFRNLARLAGPLFLLITAVMVLVEIGLHIKCLIDQRSSPLPSGVPEAIIKRNVQEPDNNAITMEFLWTPPNVANPSMTMNIASAVKSVVEASDIELAGPSTANTEPVTVYLTTTMYEASKTMPSVTSLVQAGIMAELKHNVQLTAGPFVAAIEPVAALTQMKSLSSADQGSTTGSADLPQVFAADPVSSVTPTTPSVSTALGQTSVLINEHDETCQGGCSYLSPAQPPQPSTTPNNIVNVPVCSPYLVATFFGQCPFGGITCHSEPAVTSTCTTTTTVSSCTSSVVVTVTSYPSVITVIQTLLSAGSCAPVNGGTGGATTPIVLTLDNTATGGVSVPATVPSASTASAIVATPALSSLEQSINAATASSLLLASNLENSIGISATASNAVVSTSTSVGNEATTSSSLSNAVSATSAPSTIATSGPGSTISSSSIATASIASTPTSSSTGPLVNSLSQLSSSVATTSSGVSSDGSSFSSQTAASGTSSTLSQPQTNSVVPTILLTDRPSSSAGASLVNPIPSINPLTSAPIVSQITAAPILSAVALPTSALGGVKSLASDLLGDASSIIGGNALSSIVTEVNSIVGNLPVVGSVVAPLVGNVESLVTGVIGGLTGVAAQVTSIAGGIVDPLLGGLGGAGSIVGPLVSDVGNIVGDVTSLAGGILDPITGIAGGLLDPSGVPLAPVISEILGPSGLVPAVVSEVTGVVNGVTSVVAGLVSEVTVVVGGVTSIADAVLNPVLSDVAPAVGGIVAPVTAIVGGVEMLVGGILSGVGGLALGLGQGLGGLGGLLVEVSATSENTEVVRTSAASATLSEYQTEAIKEVEVTVTRIVTSTFRG